MCSDHVHQGMPDLWQHRKSPLVGTGVDHIIIVAEDNRKGHISDDVLVLTCAAAPLYKNLDH